MEANELRIGNWVYLSSHKEHIGEVHLGFNKRNTDLFTPITLTEEWLLKFGAEKRVYSTFGGDINHIELKLNNNFCLEIDQEGYLVIECEDSYYSENLKHIQHVHQLQNLYFALTGEELTIK